MPSESSRHRSDGAEPEGKRLEQCLREVEAIARDNSKQMNPYSSPASPDPTESIVQQPDTQETIVLGIATYVLHSITLWVTACFHHFHNGSELNVSMQSVVDRFGLGGLFGVAAVLAWVPTLAYVVILSSANRRLWKTRPLVYRSLIAALKGSLGLTLALDVIFGLKLFTTG